MLDRETEVCICHGITAGDIADFIKSNNIESIEELYDNDEFEIANKCESCKDEGYYDDGVTIPLVFHLVQKGKL